VISFVLAAVMAVMGWVMQRLPPVVSAIGFAVIGYHFLTDTP
jgi:hypothetical protein